MLAQYQHARDPPIGPAEACMTSTAEQRLEHDAWLTMPHGSSQSSRRSRPWRGRPRRFSSCSSRMCSVWPKETSPASKSASEVTLIALYDVGVHGGHLAHGALPALLAVADGHLLPLSWGGARGGDSVVIVNVTLLSIIMWRCLMPRARLERMVPSRRGHV